MKLLKFGMIGLFLIGGCTTTVEKIAESLMNKTVLLEIPVLMTEDEGDVRAGIIKCSGVLISESGHILTCAHCVEDPRIISINIVQYDGTVSKAVVLASNANKDLALLKINGHKLPYAVLADPDKMAVGQDVVAVGYPLGFGFSVTKGIISAVHRNDLDPHRDMTQSDTAINPGNSGGPLFNMKEELVGINSCMVPPVNAPVFTGLGFSVSPSQIKEFLDAFRDLSISVTN